MCNPSDINPDTHAIYKPSDVNPWLSELRAQLRTSVPATISMLLYRLPWLISLSFAGRIGSKEMAAAALATSLCNITGMSLSVGLGSAITTLAGQARGQLLARGEARARRMRREKNNSTENGWDNGNGFAGSSDVENYSSVEESTPLIENNNYVEDESSPILPLVYLYRGFFIQLAFVLPVGFAWLRGIKPLLIHLGQAEELSTMTERYLQILAPGLWGYSANFTLTIWLQVMDLAQVPACATFVGAVLHVPINLFFIRTMGWGYLGVGAATTMSQIIQPMLMLAYLKGTAHGRAQLLRSTGARGIGRTHLSFRREALAAISSLSGILQYLALALPSLLAVSEWWASEIAIFLAGRLGPDPDVAMVAMAIYQSLYSSCFMFPAGMSVGGSARIGSLLGSRDGMGARSSAMLCVAGTGLVSITLGSVLYFTPHTTFPSLFTPDVGVINMTSRLIPLLSIYVFADGLQVGLNAIIKGCGRQCVLVPIVIIAYWCVALPLAWHFAFVRSGGSTDCEERTFCGVVGLVAGMTMGTWVHFILLAIYCAGMIDWPLEAKLVQERLGLESGIRRKRIDDESMRKLNENLSLVSITSSEATDF